MVYAFFSLEFAFVAEFAKINIIYYFDSNLVGNSSFVTPLPLHCEHLTATEASGQQVQVSEQSNFSDMTHFSNPLGTNEWLYISVSALFISYNGNIWGFWSSCI